VIPIKGEGAPSYASGRHCNTSGYDIAMMLGYGYSMGPIETGDLVGLDTRLRIYESMFQMTKDPAAACRRRLPRGSQRKARKQRRGSRVLRTGKGNPAAEKAGDPITAQIF
jgi:3-hydroxyacyl-CoA dehydrogenase